MSSGSLDFHIYPNPGTLFQQPAKGLEFPVVVLGSVYKKQFPPSAVETSVRNLLDKGGEPLERIGKFDEMRMFYVALSRAQNLLVLPQYTHGSAASFEFKSLFDEGRLPEICGLDLSSIPKAERKFEELGKTYSYTGDFLNYRRCPRNYMVFSKYGFVPSRSQTMAFGRLVHETIEDLHHLVMQEAGN